MKVGHLPTNAGVHSKSAAVQTDISVTIGENIGEARRALGWKQSELAERSGLSRSYVAKIESFNARNVPSSTLHAIAGTLGVPTFMLVLGRDDWKTLVDVVLADGPNGPRDRIEGYLRSEGRISAEDVERIEASSASPLKKERHVAIAETNAVVGKILGLKPSVPNDPQDGVERSMTAATGMAIAMIPSAPIVNGVIATIISTYRSPPS